MKTKKNDENFLEYVPTYNVPWEKDEEGNVFLIKERTRKPWLKKLIAFFKRPQHFHIHLDSIGTKTWLAIDGTRNVGQIAQILSQEMGPEFQQPEQRVSTFFGQMHRNAFIRFL